MPVNLGLVAEGEEEIGSPHTGQLVHRPEVEAALLDTIGVFMPMALQGHEGEVTVALAARGAGALERVASGEKWGRGPSRAIHSSPKAMADAPAWAPVQALHPPVFDAGSRVPIDGHHG